MEVLTLTLELTIDQPLLGLIEAWRTIVEVGELPDIVLDLLIGQLDLAVTEILTSEE